MRYFLLCLTALFAVSCGGADKSPVAIAKVTSNDMILQEYMWRFVFQTPAEQLKIIFSSEPFQPLPSDIAVYETDLNEDGKPDFIASIIHFRYYENGTYPLYIMMRDNYGGYTPTKLSQRTANFDVKVLPEKSNGMQNIMVDGKPLLFDGKTYISGF
ncbi:hypothetical protein [Seleniivibrio woodruffii]|uniref:hypothetical protein n=1 Tax=Seleniivibrio woodruffii TaxID=1078050 RepID=UPI0026EF0ABB|nr:hypothetical protein [Seleniivibrio woodruffii]